MEIFIATFLILYTVYIIIRITFLLDLQYKSLNALSCWEINETNSLEELDFINFDESKKYLRDWINVLFGFNWSKGVLIKKEIRNKVIKFWNKDFLEELNNKYEKVDNG
jgi:hypothetical protein